MDKINKRLLVLIGACAAAVLFVVFLIIGITYSGGAFAKTVLILISLLVLALALELGYIWVLTSKVVPNYFLFNGNVNRNMPLEKLNFQTINVRMNKYLSAFAPSEGKLWTDKILDDPAIRMEEHFKPLVAYKLLFDLAERDIDAAWKCFELASAQTVEFIAAGLEMNGDAEFAKTLRRIKSTTPVELTRLRDLLLKNKRYLQGRMYNYVKQNITKF